MMGTEMVPEMPVSSYNQLMWLIAEKILLNLTSKYNV
jgi:hypothetical protein